MSSWSLNGKILSASKTGSCAGRLGGGTALGFQERGIEAVGTWPVRKGWFAMNVSNARVCLISS